MTAADSKDRPRPSDDPGTLKTEPIVREPKMPWSKAVDDPGELRSESIPLEERSRPEV